MNWQNRLGGLAEKAVWTGRTGCVAGQNKLNGLAEQLIQTGGITYLDWQKRLFIWTGRKGYLQSLDWQKTERTKQAEKSVGTVVAVEDF